MKLITKRDSETGKKAIQLSKRMLDSNEKAIKLAKELGGKGARGGFDCVGGGISSIEFDKAPDAKLWKHLRYNEYMPKLNIKAGKEIQKRIDNLPVVRNHEMNEIIDAKVTFGHIGWNTSRDDVVGFITKEKWQMSIPEDCEEITITKWNELFPEHSKED